MRFPHTVSLAALAALTLTACSAPVALLQRPDALPAGQPAPAASTDVSREGTPNGVSSSATDSASPSPTKKAKKTRTATPTPTASETTATPTPTPTPTATATPSETATTVEKQRASEGVDCDQVKCVALTYDDGPSKYTDTLLDTLEKNDAKATFFILGVQAEAYPDVVQRMVDLGMGIGNHTYNHSWFKEVSAADQRAEIKRGSNAIKDAGGVRPTLLRPPYGDFTQTTLNGSYPIILWDVDTMDWSTRSSSETIRRTLDEVRPGSIVLMHDIQPSSVRAAATLVPKLKARGYHLVTVDTLLGGNADAGEVYHSKNG